MAIKLGSCMGLARPQRRPNLHRQSRQRKRPRRRRWHPHLQRGPSVQSGYSLPIGPSVRWAADYEQFWLLGLWNRTTDGSRWQYHFTFHQFGELHLDKYFFHCSKLDSAIRTYLNSIDKSITLYWSPHEQNKINLTLTRQYNGHPYRLNPEIR